MSKLGIQAAVDTLNGMLRTDYDSLSKLATVHVVGNADVCSKYPTYATSRDDYPAIKLIGLLEVVNAIFATPLCHVATASDGDELRFVIVRAKRKRSK